MLSSNSLVSAFKPWRTARLIFRVGRKVEVSFEEEDLRDVWFPATVLDDLGNDSFLVEYQCSGINDEAQLRKVTVDHLHIRPSAPRLRDKNFVLLEKVDAFYDFGWWSGVITKELADSRYVVFFKHTNKERELSHLQLRPHVEWKDGKWFSPYQDPVFNDAHVAENAVVHDESSSVKCSTEETTTLSFNLTEPIEQTTPDIDKGTSVLTSSMKRTKPTSPGSNDKHLKPSKKLKAGIASDDPSLSNMGPNMGQTKEVRNPPVGQSGGNNSKEAIISDQTVGKTENLSHGKKMRGKRGEGIELNSTVMNSARKKGKLTAVVRSPEALPQGATGDLANTTTPDIVEKEHATKDLPLPVVIGLQCNGMTVSRGKKLQQLPGENTPNIAEGETQQSGVPLAPKTTVNVEGKEGDAETIPKRKRGRPPKSQAKRPKTSLAVNHQNGDVVPSAVTVEGSERNVVGSPIRAGTESEKERPVPEKEQLKFTGNYDAPKQKNTSRTVMDTPLVNVDKLPNESSGKASTARQGKYKSVKGKRGKRRTISSINIESSAQDCKDSSKEKANGGLEKDSAVGNSELPVEKSLDTMSDDQPLSRWFEGMHSSTAVDGAATAPQRTVEQSSEASKKQLENFKFPLAAVNGNIVAGDGQNLPFVKCTSLWQTIESMEAFRVIPQKPHFCPLNGVKESAREGLAICSMVNFSRVVEKTSGLRLDDPRSAIEDCLETLVELESHGFDVKLIRNRLTGLLLIKDKQEELQAQAKELRDKIEEQNVEGGRIDKEIEVLDKQIRELQERRAQVLSKKEKKGSEIAALEAEVDGIDQGMHEARLKFDGLAAASW